MTSRDPLDGVDGTPTVANPYHYADNDPLNKQDPLGLRPTEADMDPPELPDPKPCGPDYGCGSDYDTIVNLEKYRWPDAAASEVRRKQDEGMRVGVRWVEPLGGGATALAYMDGPDFLDAQREIHEAERATDRQSLWEKIARFGVTTAVGFVVATVCTYGFLMCVGGAVIGTAAGTAGLAGTDYLFGHEIGWQEDITDAGLAAAAGAICGTAFKATCGKAFGFRLRPSGVALTANAKKVAFIWGTKFTLDQLIR